MPSVLVVDDQDQVRQLIRETLEQAGYEVEEACDGKEGLDRYRVRSTDLVIMDILMPDQDGLETIMTLRQEFPDIRIIAMTGGKRYGRHPQFLRRGKNAWSQADAPKTIRTESSA